MRPNTFLIVVLCCAVGCAMIVLVEPLLWETYVTRSGGLESPDNPTAYADYIFESAAVGYRIPSSNEITVPVGLLNVSWAGASLRFNETLTDAYLPSKSALRQSWVVSPDSPFAEAIFCPTAWSSGQLVAVDGEPSVVGAATFPYTEVYQGTWRAIADPSFIGQTDPLGLRPVHPNETGINQTYAQSIAANEFDYDSAQGSQVLVRYDFSGNSTFVEQVLRGFAIANVTGFLMDLISTNIVLGPLDLSHYVGQNVFLALLTGVAIFIPTFMIWRRARMRAQKNRERGAFKGRVRKRQSDRGHGR